MEIYVVKPGDTVAGIAAAHRIGADTVIYDNQLVYPYQLAVGQALLLNTGAGEKSRTVHSNGYAYTYIEPMVLDSTLPFLSELSVFSYGFTTEGALVYPPRDDTWMVNSARQYRVRPLLTLTPLNADGNFDNSLVTALVHNPAARKRLFTELLAVMEEKGYGGGPCDCHDL